MRYGWFSVNNDLSKMAAENLSSDPSLGNLSLVLSPPQRLRGKTAGREECGRKRREGFHPAVFSLSLRRREYSSEKVLFRVEVFKKKREKLTLLEEVSLYLIPLPMAIQFKYRCKH